MCVYFFLIKSIYRFKITQFQPSVYNLDFFQSHQVTTSFSQFCLPFSSFPLFPSF